MRPTELITSLHIRYTYSHMKLDEELAQPSIHQDSVLTIGVFDGVHRGHQHLITRLIAEARNMGRLAGVVTFRNHPATILRTNFKPRYLTDAEERIRLIRDLGVDFVVPVTFDLDVSKLRARDFVARLRQHLSMRGLVVGPDFGLGHKREGDAEKLKALGQEMGFSVKVVDVIEDGGQPIRSTTIRQALAQGDVARVAELVDRKFALAGRVVKGVSRGKRLGFPTANLKVPAEMAIPGDGIYATRARVGESWYMAATSIGTRPTFDESELTVEAFLLDFEGDLYDQHLRLEFVQRLRDEVKFDTVQELQEQVDRDVAQTRAVLLSSRLGPG